MFIYVKVGNISWLNVILRASIQAHQFRIILYKTQTWRRLVGANIVLINIEQFILIKVGFK